MKDQENNVKQWYVAHSETFQCEAFELIYGTGKQVANV